MFWQKKENKEGLPDLPSVPVRTQFPSQTEEEFEAALNRPLNQNMRPSPLPDSQAKLPDLPSLGESINRDKTRVIEMDEWKPSQAPSRFPQLSEIQPVSQGPKATHELFSYPAPQEAPRAKESGQLFVRLDKFQSARQSLDTINTKLEDVEELLKRIRETKMKEDAELSAWEKELQAIKSRIKSVNTELFDKVE